MHVYDQPGINEFHFLAKGKSAYIDFNKGIEEMFIKYNTVLANQLINSSGNIVILFTSSKHLEMLLTEVQTLYSFGTSKRQFLWITRSND